jgi:hypothetical protein
VVSLRDLANAVLRPGDSSSRDRPDSSSRTVGETKRATGEAFGRSLCLFPVGTHRKLRGLAQNRPPGGASAGAVAAVNERSPPHRPGEA